MPNLKKATYAELIDMLNAQTTAYISMLRTNDAPQEQFDKCKYQLRKIQKEIEARNASPGAANSDNTGSNSSFIQQDSNPTA
jgi:hypothetical protein